MNVLKSVTANRSEIDLTEAGKDSNPDQRKSSGFSFFGMRSKSKENVIDTNPAEDNTEEVKKLPTLDDKTIDKNKKFAPMENLTDAAKTKPKGSGFARFKRIRDEMFRKKHQTLKEEDAKEGEFYFVKAGKTWGRGAKGAGVNILAFVVIKYQGTISWSQGRITAGAKRRQ